jgi:hypothetical protein
MNRGICDVGIIFEPQQTADARPSVLRDVIVGFPFNGNNGDNNGTFATL